MEGHCRALKGSMKAYCLLLICMQEWGEEYFTMLAHPIV